MKNSMTPKEAFLDFWESTGKDISPSPTELRKAIQTAKGRQSKKGKPVNLGVERVARLLEKYAPGQYLVNEPTFTKVCE